ncbi:MAG TPA: DMT family transporter [Flavisolibacter sp.]|nr:DMT family transporter [Flavisolibacter sp.]
MNRYIWIVAGLLFALLWASASTATKLGLTTSQPLVIAVVRFGVAAAIMLVYSHFIRGNRLPTGKEWTQLTLYGLLNITIYLGFYVIAMQSVTAGIGALAIATNPVMISFLSVFFLKKKLTWSIITALLFGSIGVWVAAWPLLGQASVTIEGLMILLFSMFSYSAGAIYFSAKDWNALPLFTINGWQTLIGGLLLLPFAALQYDSQLNNFNATFWTAVLWLAIPVSIVAVQIWLWLLQRNAVKAGLWLFICPLFGFSIAAWILKDPLSIHTLVGVALVIGGLAIAQRNTKR